jgi:hypothetical protein
MREIGEMPHGHWPAGHFASGRTGAKSAKCPCTISPISRISHPRESPALQPGARLFADFAHFAAVLTDLFDEVFGGPAEVAAPPHLASAAAHPRWRITFPDGRATVVVVAPEMTEVEVRQRYPDADVVEAIGPRALPTLVPVGDRPYQRPLVEWPTPAVQAEAADLRRVQAEAAAHGLGELAAACEIDAKALEAAVEQRRPVPPPVASCRDCRHVTRYGNCGEPVEAGIASKFELVRHPRDGAGCGALDPPSDA